MAIFWEGAAHSVDHMFSLYTLDISRFGFEGGIWVLIAPVPGHCILVTITEDVTIIFVSFHLRIERYFSAFH